MTQHFTTPEFAEKLMYQFKIEIPSVFRWQSVSTNPPFKGAYLVAIDTLDDTIKATIDWMDTEFIGTAPAYPLIQVLGWLPKFYRTPIGSVCNREFKATKKGAVLAGYSVWRKSNAKFYPIEDLIIQGLTEGWLNKDNLNLTT